MIASIHPHSSSARHDAAFIRDAAHTLDDLSPLVALAGDAQFVLIGEASHGTHEFYALRAELTKRLIQEKGFRVLALEADWPDTLRAHRYVTESSPDANAVEALGEFKRFPAWMWRNTVMVDFLDWLRARNQLVTAHDRPVGIYGMDLYSLHASMDAVIHYLDKADPEAAHRARQRYSCFEYFGDDPQRYGYMTTRQGAEPCEDEVVAQLVDLRRRYGSVLGSDGQAAENEHFYAEQNARVVAGAEAYYRAMFRGRNDSWNLRDTHMAETLGALVKHFDAQGRGPAKVIVWAHNSHLGDARATEMADRGEVNVGQLARERFGSVFSIGFSTWDGEVTAASDWGAPAERKRVRPALPGSYEDLFHAVGLPRFWISLRRRGEAATLLGASRLQRAIGVVYRPETERASHYFKANLARQFDVMIHVDRTLALQPLERTSAWEIGELPDTYPAGI
jgi:erythromycin esterase-like protein